ncbi:MAG: hypothetical protein E7373_06460 [Clostridiales bacterium]|nr:hypothetical protein [Clostridiales bacterium]
MEYQRFTPKLFGETALATGSDPQISQFGSALAGTFLGTTDPATIQALSAWSSGFIGAVTPSEQFPPLPETTGVLKVFSYLINMLYQQGVPVWDSGTDYYTNNFCSRNGKIYFSNTDNNQGNDPLTDTTNWSDYVTSVISSSIDGQWVSSYHSLSSESGSGLFIRYINAFLPNDNYNYLCQFSVNFYDYGDDSGSMYFETDIYQVGNASARNQLHVSQGNKYGRHNSNVFTMPVGPERYVKWYCTDANTSREFALVGYRRLGTNS